jgi:hypothetical protein
MEPVTGAMHDITHMNTDTRNEETMQAILDLIAELSDSGLDVYNHYGLICDIVVTRYNLLMNTLVSYIEEKERIAAEELEQLNSSNPDTIREDSAHIRQQYNAAIVPLFYLFHEEYAFNASALMASNFAESMRILCDNGKSQDSKMEAYGQDSNQRVISNMDYLQTYLNPLSNMSDKAILAIIMQQPISMLGIYIDDANIKTIGEYEKHLDFSRFSVERNAIKTTVSFYCKKPVKKIVIVLPTMHYLVNSAQDNNLLLHLAGCHVNASVLDKDKLKLLPLKELQRIVSDWYKAVEVNMDAVLDNLCRDLRNFQSPNVDRYNTLVTKQNADLHALLPAVPAESSVTP